MDKRKLTWKEFLLEVVLVCITASAVWFLFNWITSPKEELTYEPIYTEQNWQEAIKKTEESIRLEIAQLKCETKGGKIKHEKIYMYNDYGWCEKNAMKYFWDESGEWVHKEIKVLN